MTIPDDVDVYRVLPPSLIHKPPGAKLPTWEAFRPTDEDKKHKPIRVSVWDSTKTTAREAVGLRRALATDPARPFDAYAVCTGLVVAAGRRNGRADVQVVLDPAGLHQALVGQPGAAGHSGIEGLSQGAAAKPAWKTFLNEIAEACREVT